eukprot:Em0005g323a
MVYFKDRPVAPVKARLILDSSSQKSYISAELKDMLKPPLEQSVTMSIKTFGSEAENLDLATLDKKCQAFWEFDSLGIREEQDYSIVATVFQIPWKEPHPLLPDNFDLSKGRLLNLLKQLQQTPNILSQYDSIIQDQMEMTAADIEKAFLMVTVAEEDREALFFLAPASSSDQLNVTDSPVTYDESYTKNTLGDKLEVSECVKVLGVKWKPLDNSLLHDDAAMKPTKRNIIGLSARIYDPLRLLSPVTVQFKIYVCCKAELG